MNLHERLLRAVAHIFQTWRGLDKFRYCTVFGSAFDDVYFPNQNSERYLVPPCEMDFVFDSFKNGDIGCRAVVTQEVLGVHLWEQMSSHCVQLTERTPCTRVHSHSVK